jgi:hypothetical protein
MNTQLSTTNFSVAGISVRQDAEGRFCLNDLHKAAGGEVRHRPATWLQNQQTLDLIAETSIDGIPSILTKQGLGTFVCKELVYAYAMWISAKFQVQVIRAYDALVSQMPVTLSAVDIQLKLLESFDRKVNLSKAGLVKSYAAIGASHGVDTRFLPSYTDEPLTKSLSELLRDHQLPMSAVKVNKILEKMGYLKKAYRLGRDAKTNKQVEKEFWVITEYGLRFGKNDNSVQKVNETQPHWYVDKFLELMAEIDEFLTLD